MSALHSHRAKLGIYKVTSPSLTAQNFRRQNSLPKNIATVSPQMCNKHSVTNAGTFFLALGRAASVPKPCSLHAPRRAGSFHRPAQKPSVMQAVASVSSMSTTTTVANSNPDVSGVAAAAADKRQATADARGIGDVDLAAKWRKPLHVPPSSTQAMWSNRLIQVACDNNWRTLAANFV